LRFQIFLIQVAWLHSEKGTLAVHPHVITQNDRISVSSDHRNTYNLKLRDIRYTEAVFLVMLVTSSFPARHEVYGKTTFGMAPNNHIKRLILHQAKCFNCDLRKIGNQTPESTSARSTQGPSFPSVEHSRWLVS